MECIGDPPVQLNERFRRITMGFKPVVFYKGFASGAHPPEEQACLMPRRQPYEFLNHFLSASEYLDESGQAENEIDPAGKGGFRLNPLFRIPNEASHVRLPDQPQVLHLQG